MYRWLPRQLLEFGTDFPTREPSARIPFHRPGKQLIDQFERSHPGKNPVFSVGSLDIDFQRGQRDPAEINLVVHDAALGRRRTRRRDRGRERDCQRKLYPPDKNSQIGPRPQRPSPVLRSRCGRATADR
jgi:hypothetical protein